MPAAATAPVRRSKTALPAQKATGTAISAKISDSARVAASPSPTSPIQPCRSR